ncbi:hypothetical protein HanIR_Chr02g0085551 [Helianthus annuus]|nr:hypothetical protein HanIR_Chr02g0085551 [Helianthus annuus]
MGVRSVSGFTIVEDWRSWEFVLQTEIAEEFAREYFCLPFDDDKVPHIVTVVSG